MKFLKRSSLNKNRFFQQIFFREDQKIEIHQVQNLPSRQLGREVRLDIYLPSDHYTSPQLSYPTLFFNDGQDLEAVGMAATLERLYKEGRMVPLIAIGIHAGDRIQEYGAASKPDYKNRGAKAGRYTRFIIEELLPFLELRYRISDKAAERTFAGFSLGGLSAFDIVWNNPGLFGKAGIFSGSLWWRSKAFSPKAPDAHRIAHEMVEKSGRKKEGLKFWLEAGTRDEEADRNNNGIIDAIDDTLDLIKNLEKKGYRQGEDIKYVEVIGGEHNPATWAKVLPDFLQWTVGQSSRFA